MPTFSQKEETPQEDDKAETTILSNAQERKSSGLHSEPVDMLELADAMQPLEIRDQTTKPDELASACDSNQLLSTCLDEDKISSDVSRPLIKDTNINQERLALISGKAESGGCENSQAMTDCDV